MKTFNTLLIGYSERFNLGYTLEDLHSVSESVYEDDKGRFIYEDLEIKIKVIKDSRNKAHPAIRYYSLSNNFNHIASIYLRSFIDYELQHINEVKKLQGWG